jgi:hypothetical protein
MKLAVRILALSVAFSGIAAATAPSATTQFMPSHLSATSTRPTPSSMPVPGCGPTRCTTFLTSGN